MTDEVKELHPLMRLAEELAGVSLLDSGQLNPFFLIGRDTNAYQIPVNFDTQEKLEFTSVKIAALLQSEGSDHYAFASTIQFKAQAGDKMVMKQQVIILFAEKTETQNYQCDANLYDLKLNTKLGKPQLKKTQTIEDYDGQFSNLLEAPPIPDELKQRFKKDLDQYQLIEG